MCGPWSEAALFWRWKGAKLEAVTTASYLSFILREVQLEEEILGHDAREGEGN